MHQHHTSTLTSHHIQPPSKVHDHMQPPHFTLDLKPLEHYFNFFIFFQLEQPFNSIISTIGTGMNHAMSPGALFQWTPFKINRKA